jgi:uncharacterized protein YbjQ (UPF0145 family)
LRDSEARDYKRPMDDVIISTMNDLPGYTVIAVHGEVFGLVVMDEVVIVDKEAAFDTARALAR